MRLVQLKINEDTFLCTEKYQMLKITGIDTDYCGKLTLFDPKIPLIFAENGSSYGLCMISASKQE